MHSVARWLPVHEPLAFCPTNGRHDAIAIVGFPRVPAELKLRHVAVQMPLANSVERAVKAPLDQGEEALGGVRIDIPARIVTSPVWLTAWCPPPDSRPVMG